MRRRGVAALLALLMLFYAGVAFAEEADDDPILPQEITAVLVTGVTAPERFALPAMDTLACDSPDVTLESAVWEVLSNDEWLPLEEPFAAQTTYRLRLLLAAGEGAVFSDAVQVQTDAEPEEILLLSVGETLEAAVYFAPLALPYYAVRVTDGLASIDGRVITEAQPGTAVQLRASVLREGETFDHWVVVSGDVELQSPGMFYAGFVMPEGDVEIAAVFRPAEEADACPYCGRVHSGFFGGIVRWFHAVLQYFRDSFG